MPQGWKGSREYVELNESSQSNDPHMPQVAALRRPSEVTHSNELPQSAPARRPSLLSSVRGQGSQSASYRRLPFSRLGSSGHQAPVKPVLSSDDRKIRRLYRKAARSVETFYFVYHSLWFMSEQEYNEEIAAMERYLQNATEILAQLGSIGYFDHPPDSPPYLFKQVQFLQKCVNSMEKELANPPRSISMKLHAAASTVSSIGTSAMRRATEWAHTRFGRTASGSRAPGTEVEPNLSPNMSQEDADMLAHLRHDQDEVGGEDDMDNTSPLLQAG